MKKLIFLLSFIFSLTVSQKLDAQADHSVIYGNIEGAEGVKFVLQSNSSGKIVSIDSAVVVNGRFTMMRGSAKYPELDYLVAPEKGKGVTFFLENSVITISGKLDSLSNVKITGSKSQNDYVVLQKTIKPISDKVMKLSNEYKAANDALMTEMKNAQKEFIKNNPKSFVSPVILRTLTRDMKPEEIEEIINGLDPVVAKSPLIMDIKTKMTAQLMVVVGKKAPDFILNDMKGKQVSLSSKIGSKLLLIDFWAGWCGPCRQENPNVLKVYNEFKKDGFDIIGVSLDRNKDEWVKAIKDDKLPWTQVSDLQYFNSEAAKLYNVTAIPANFLLDEKGIIVAVNLRGEALHSIVYGRLVSGTVTDVDGNVYNTVPIGKQVWMTENLKTTKYRNGDPVPNMTDSLQWWQLKKGAYCSYRNDVNISKTYGYLYNWHSVNDPRNIAPQGWHVASDAEWETLMNYLGGEGIAGSKLKESGLTHWKDRNKATNETGFTALPSGVGGGASGRSVGLNASWWTTTEADEIRAVSRNAGWAEGIFKQTNDKKGGKSVRCIKD